MNVVAIENPMTARLRGRRLTVTVWWQPCDPFAFTLRFANGEAWVVSRDAVADALAGKQMDRATFDAAEIEIFRTVDDLFDQIEITRYDRQLQPVPVFFEAGDWQRLLDDSTCIAPLDTEHEYIQWRAEFPEVYR